MIGPVGPERPVPRRFDPLSATPSPAERAALWIQLGLIVALEVAFMLAAWTLAKSVPALMIPSWQKVAFQVGLALAFTVFGLRARRLWRRLHTPAPPLN